MRKIIAFLQTSVDGFIEGPNGELDWAMAEDEETWRELDDTLNSVNTFILGRGMYPACERHWLALLANPTGTKNENAYARRADKLPHIVLSDPRQGGVEDDTNSSGCRGNPGYEATTGQRHADLRWCHFNIQLDESTPSS